jgi:PEGA domain-containing protein
MSRTTRCCVLAGLAALLVAPSCLAGGNSTQGRPSRAHNVVMAVQVRPVVIVSKPIGARVQINGQYVGNTPLVVDFAVDELGHTIRDIEVRAIAQATGAVDDVRWFPAADGNASVIPDLLDFDLNIVPVYFRR